MADIKKPYFFCELCNVSCSNEGNKYGHLVSSRHSQNVEELKAKTDGRKRTANGARLDDAPVRQDQYGPVDFKGVKTPLVGLQYVLEKERIPPNNRRNFSCDLCNSQLGIESVIPHVQGLKHRMEYLKKHSETDFNLISCLPRSEQSVAVVSMAQQCEMKHGRGKIKYLPLHLQQKRPEPREEAQEYQNFMQRVRSNVAQANIPALFPERGEPRNNRPYYDEQPRLREEFADALYPGDYRDGPNRKYARRGEEYHDVPHREDPTFGVISRTVYQEKMAARGNIRDAPVNEYENVPPVRHGDDYRRPDDRYDELRERERVLRERERERELLERERERERELEYERRMMMAEKPLQPAVAPPQQFQIERLLQADDGNFRLSGGNLGALLSVLGKVVVRNEDDAQMALQVSNALTQSLLKYRFQSMPGELLSATLSKSAENFLGNQSGVMGGFGNPQLQQNTFMREQAMSRDQGSGTQLEVQQQQLRQQLQMLQEQQNEFDMKRKIKEDLRQEMHKVPHQQPRDDEDRYQQYASARGGSSYVYDQY